MNTSIETQTKAPAPAATGSLVRNLKPRRRISPYGVIALLLGLAGTAASAQEEGTVTAYRAFDFTRAIGIRMAPADANYQAHWTTVKNKFAPLKIKYVRLDGIPLGSDSSYLGWVNELKTTSQVGGTKFDFVFGNALLSQNAMENSIDAALGTNAAFSFEGPNEYSKHWYKEDLEPAHESDDWHLYVRDFYVNFKSYLRNNGFPSGPIVGPSMWKRDQWAYTTIAGTSVPGNCTVANLHYYFPAPDCRPARRASTTITSLLATPGIRSWTER